MSRIQKVLIFVLSVVCCMPFHLAHSAETLEIVTSFYPMYAITKEVVGDKHTIKMINSGNGIHGFEPSAADVAAIYDADIFIYHSKTLESWTKNYEVNIQQSGNSDVVLVEASQGMELLKVPGLEGMELLAGKDASTLYDPHTWLDPIEVGAEAMLIATRLGEIDPENADYYKANAQKMMDEANRLVEAYTPIFAALKHKTFVTQHTAFSYLANRFGLEQLGIAGVSSEIEASPKQLEEVQQFIQEYQVKTIFTEPNVSDRAAKIIAEATGVKIEVLSPLESDPHNDLSFMENLENNLKILSNALKAEEELR